MLLFTLAYLFLAFMVAFVLLAIIGANAPDSVFRRSSLFVPLCTALVALVGLLWPVVLVLHLLDRYQKGHKE